MDKTFQPQTVEIRWRQRWEELGIGHSDVHSPRPKYSIALPPPNITGALHMGHACGFSIQDTLCRQKRMAGFEVEWCPGTDHAAIATQNVIERQLAEEGTSKEELGRERFQARVDAWYEEFGGRIYEQMRRLGYTCDWSRSRFTLDDAYVRAIRVVFKALYEEGLIYRGPRIVNWCPHDRSAISDEEIDWQKHVDNLYYLRYPVDTGEYIEVATVRPETMLGDTGVAVAPGDPRYAHLVGHTVVLPLTARRLPIFEDASVRPEFGTGAVKVTPAHDPTDYDIGQRHALPAISVIAPDGAIDFPTLPQFHGLPAEEARTAVAEALREVGALLKVEEYEHEVGHCDRCGHVLEPLISEQWWVRMKTLAAPGIEVVEKGEITFHPERYAGDYLAWMRNIRDWCISRQIWLGHQIPVSTCGNGHVFAWVEAPSACPQCGDVRLTHDQDVLDTWFSSALWPFAIFGWPEDTEDLRRFYPTDVLVTGRDIIFLWVARMIMTGLKFTGKKPFSQTMITSIIQAADGSRMSKSKGNVVDPMDMVERYGADAVRAWAAAVGTGSQDVRFDADRIEAFQRFANKLWNVTRLLVTRLGDGADVIAPVAPPHPDTLEAVDRWMLAELAGLVRACDASFTNYRFHDAVDRLYDTTWHSFCDWYAEIVKRRTQPAAPAASRAAAAWTAVTVLDVLLRLLHPFMPFVTEECAQHLPDATESLQLRPWPHIETLWTEPATIQAHADVTALLELVSRIRALRQELGGSAPREPARAVVRGALRTLSAATLSSLLESLAAVIVVPAHDPDMRPAVVVAGPLHAEVVIPAAAASNGHARQLKELERRIAGWESQLANPQFVERAPADVVETARRNLADATAQLAVLRGMSGHTS